MSEGIDRAQLEAFREDASEIMNEWEAACLKVQSASRDEVFQALMRCAHNLKGNAGLMGFELLSSSMHRLEDRLIELSKSGADPREVSLLAIFLEIEKLISRWLKKMADDPTYVPDSLSVLSKLEAWGTGVSVDGQGPVPAAMGGAQEVVTPANEQVRIASQKLDLLIQLVGELTLAQAIVSHGRAEDQLETVAVREAIGLCDKLVRNLRLAVLDMRMLPMAGLYGKLERAGMELSIYLKKPLKLLLEGQEVSVDKAVLNKIFDPMLHILRNAVDHGLEMPDERRAKGKPMAGTIIVSASIVPSGVCISIRDDGRGLDIERIKAKAIERGLIQADKEISAERAQHLIFEPGFSTADTLSTISGRGVGLDVVKREVLNLGGQIDIKTTPGHGSEFIITLPVNISLIDVLVVHNKGTLYCVPTQDIAEVLDLSDLKIEKSTVHGQMVRYRERVLPIESVEYFLQQTFVPHAQAEVSPKAYVLVVNYQGQVLGVRVDDVTHQQQVFVRSLKGYMASLPCLTGSTILANGEPSLIINVKEMANSYFSKQNRGVEGGERSL